MFNLLVRVSTGTKLRDTQSGLKIARGPTLRTISRIAFVKRYAFDVELLIIASAVGLRITELPVKLNFTRNGLSVRDIFEMFMDVMIISYRYRVTHWYQRQLQLHNPLTAADEYSISHS